MAVQTCMCLLDVVKRNKDIVVIFWSLMVPGLLAMHSFRCMTMHVPTQLRCYMTFIDDKCISVMNWMARSPDHNPIEHT